MLRFLTLTACVSLVPAAVLAQSGLPPSVTGHEQFVDETGITVRALAKSAGISEGAARERLKKQVAASSMISGTGATGVDVNFDTPSRPTVTIYAPASSVTKLQKANQSLSALADGAFRIVQTRFSSAQLDAMADEVIAAAEKQGVKGYIRTDQRTGAMTFVPNQSAGQSIIASVASALTLPHGAVVGAGPQIVKTASAWAGGQYLNFAGGICTSGFVGYIVLHGVASRGAITAYHCGAPGSRASMDVNSSGTYRAPSSVSAFVREYGYSFQQDMLFMRFEDGGNTTAPYFKTGQGNAVVRGATDVAWRSTVCKYGRTTGGSCGSVGYSTVRENGGTYYIVYTTTAGGDSGGPMYQGNLIAGIVYGSYGSDAMLMNPWKYMHEKYPNIYYTCNC